MIQGAGVTRDALDFPCVHRLEAAHVSGNGLKAKAHRHTDRCSIATATQTVDGFRQDQVTRSCVPRQSDDVKDRERLRNRVG